VCSDFEEKGGAVVGSAFRMEMADVVNNITKRDAKVYRVLAHRLYFLHLAAVQRATPVSHSGASAGAGAGGGGGGGGGAGGGGGGGGGDDDQDDSLNKAQRAAAAIEAEKERRRAVETAAADLKSRDVVSGFHTAWCSSTLLSGGSHPFPTLAYPRG
jgi:hypothetical protein